MSAAALTLLFDVGDFAVGGQFPVAADHAPTIQRRESQQPYEAHIILLLSFDLQISRLLDDAGRTWGPAHGLLRLSAESVKS